MAGESVYSRFIATARARPNKPFLDVLPETASIYGIATETILYAEMAHRIEKWKASFLASGYGRGHRVGLLLENRPAFLEIWFALNGLGVSVVPINPDLRASELEYIIAHSEMAAAIVTPNRRDEVAAASRVTSHEIPVITPSDEIPAPQNTAHSSINSDENTECALLYTSGTTGKPKGCVLTNEYFLYSGEWYRDAGGLISLRPEGERMLTPLPVFHMNAMAVSVMAMVTVGGCLIMLDRFHPKSWWDQVRLSRATCLHYLGVMPSILMATPRSDQDRNHHVRFGFGAGVDRRLHAAFEERFNIPLLEAWAMTETGSGATICANFEPRKIGTSCIGRPTSLVDVKIADDNGNDQKDDTPGELLVRHAGENPKLGFFSEYLKDPTATLEAWEDGWFHTGDIVSRDADGDIHFVDRKKNVIRRSGENIAAVEVESVLNRHPLIRQAGVAAVPDAIRGDEVAALIVATSGDIATSKGEEIIQWALDQMAYYKVPGWVAFVEKIPLTATEKIQRAGLKTMAAELLDAGGFQDFRHLKKRQV